VTWADLRQVVIATTDPGTVAGTLRERLGLGIGFGDPVLADFGIDDDTMAVGKETFLEVVSPTTSDHPLAALLAKRGGSTGYLLSVQVADIEACLSRCESAGVRVALHHEVQGHHVAQLHPVDMGGSSVELDGLPERGRWFWDDLDVDRPPTSRVDDITAVDVAVDDPAAMADRWSTVFGLAADPHARTLDLGRRVVHFVPRAERPGIVAVSLRTTDPDLAETRFVAGHVEFRLHL
jgi:hypothetical protein